MITNIKYLLLILSLLTPTVLCSQTTYPKILSDSTVIISNTQLKQANKLFAEGEYYKNKSKELENQVLLYKQLQVNYEKIDSLRVKEVQSLKKPAKKDHFWIGLSIGLALLNIFQWLK